ncbi:MAG: hypothetical protein RLZZ385_1664 [Pseudomonadota bacterium]|jgi:hypothetical protein
MNTPATRTDVGLVSLWIGLLLWAAPLQAEEAMANAANRFLATLAGEQSTRAAFPLDATEREAWHFVPNEMFPRNGIPLEALTPEQQAAAKALLATGLSQDGLRTANAIMALENVLKVLETNGRFVRDPQHYRISVFGTPSADGTWGWRFEGHHLSLHFTVVMGRVTVSTPSFFGSNPAEVREGWQTEEQRGQRVLARREDSARAFMLALDTEQRRAALLSDTAPNDIVTGNQYPIDPLSPAGLSGQAMTAGQRSLLREVILAYTDVMSADIAATRWENIQADGLESVSFAWSGPLEPGAPHYYRLQGPSFLIEYDNVQNGANHVHSVWRDFSGDFGRDLLREHRSTVAHQ